MLSNAVDQRKRRRELPEAVGVVDRGVPDTAASGLDNFLIDVPERVEGLPLRGVLIFVASEVCGEELLVGLDLGLCDHVVYWCLHGHRLNSVDRALCRLSATVRLG